MIKHLRQPSGSSVCGQYCVAMLAGVDPEQVIAMVGRGSTGTDKIVDALHGFGFEAELERVRFSELNVYEQTAVLYTNWYNDGKRALHGHWTLLHNGVAYDPAMEKPLPVDEWAWDMGLMLGRCTSAVLITSTERIHDEHI